MSRTAPGTGLALPDVLERAARDHPDAPLLRWRDGPFVTAAQVLDRARRIAGGLAGLGVSQGDTVLLMMPNGLDIIAAWLGATLLGAVEVPVNIHDRGSFLAHVVNDSQATVIICDPGYVRYLAAVASGCEHLRTIVTTGEPASGPESAPRRWEHRSLADLEGAARRFRRPSPGPGDLMAILYTSGTTGPAKGIMMTYGQAALNAANYLDVMVVTPDDTLYVCMPLFHSNAQVIQVMPALMAGAICSVWPRFEAGSWLDQVRSVGATVSNTLGVMCEEIYAQPSRPDDRMNPLRLLQTIPAPPRIAEDFERRFDLRCIDGYGLTDVGVVTYRRPGEPLVPGSSGRPLPQFEVVVADPGTDVPLPPGQVGEIMIRPCRPWGMMAGYWRNPEATVHAWRNLWFHTGDAGYFDEGGLLYFHDRLKDVIRVRGENVSSAQLEGALLADPRIAECAAVARPAERGDNDVHVCIVLAPDARLSPEDLIELCTGKMPYFAVPRYVTFLAELPKTPTGKVLKRELRAGHLPAPTWDRRSAGVRISRD